MTKIRKSVFQPAWWLQGAHFQTIYPSFFRKTPAIERTREKFALPDGDHLYLDWSLEGDGPLILLIHGLTGSSESKYIMGMQLRLKKLGWRSVAMNFRGCLNGPNHLPRSYHSGETGDLQSVFSYLKERFPQTEKAMVGFSLGGNVMLKWLGETKEQDALFAAVAVSVPVLLDKCVEYMERGFSKVYSKRFVRDLKGVVVNKARLFHELQLTEHIPTMEHYLKESMVETLWDFDDKVTGPLHGFAGAQDYYTRCSSRQFLQHIATPTLMIHSVDDPFMPDDIAPTAAHLSDCVTLELSHRGGHVGFISGSVPGRPVYWLEERIPAFLQSMKPS